MSLFKKIMMWLGIVVSAVIAFAAIIIAIAFYATSGLTDTVKYQLAALRSDEVVTAYHYTSKDFQKVTSLEEFKQFIDDYPALKDNKNIVIDSREISNNQGTVKGTLEAKDGTTLSVEYRLIKENDRWKILAFKVIPIEGGATIDNTPAKPVAEGSAKEPVLSNTFEDKNNKFSMKYPANWEYQQPEKATVIFSGKKGAPDYFSTVNIQTVLTKKTGGEYKTVDEFMDGLKAQVKAQSANATFMSEEPIDLQSSPTRVSMHGRLLEFSYEYKGQKFQQLQFVFMRKDGQVFYAWAYTAPVEIYETYYPVAKAMFATWSVY